MGSKKKGKPIDVTPGHKGGLPVAFHPPNMVELESDGTFPPGMQEAKGATSDVPAEWEPKNPGEVIKGYVRRMNKMQLGGMAYVFDLCPDFQSNQPTGNLLLLTKGGKVLESRLEALAVKIGDCVGIVYRGFGEAKEGQNPPRLYDVKKLVV